MQVYILGAGASAAEGAPATNELFAQAWRHLAPACDQRVQEVWRFLERVFEIPINSVESFAHVPAIDEVFSLIDWSLEESQGLGAAYDPPHLYQVKRHLEHLLCATLDATVGALRQRPQSPHTRFVRSLQTDDPSSYALLTLNYDTLLDHALVASGLPLNYGFHRLDLSGEKGPLLAKLHGSLNWRRCPACDHVEVAHSREAHLLPHTSALRCSRCGNNNLHGLIISPTWLKSYRVTQLRHVWDLALEAIQRAEQISFIGYSLPAADIALYQMLRRGLLTRRCTAMPRILVMNQCPLDAAPSQHMAQLRERYTRLFGPDVVFDFTGFQGQVIKLSPHQRVGPIIL